MSETITIDPETGEIVNEEPVAIEIASPHNLFGVARPEEVVERAAAAATALKDVVVERGLLARISGKTHVLVEGWTLLGSMLGVYPIVVWTRRLDDGSGWEARVEARTIDGNVVGAGEAMCTRAEDNWKGRDENAIRAMAQTRATSRALRGPLGFIVSLAGYQAAAAEEMPAGVEGGSSGASTRTSTAEAGTTQPAQEAGPPSTTSSLLSDHQQKSLHAQGKRKGLTHQDLHDIAGRDFGVESMTELTKQQANELMKMLNEYPDADPVVGGKEGHDG